MGRRFGFTAAALLAALVIPVAAKAEAVRTDVVIAQSVEPPNLDPTIAAPTAIREVTYGNIYEGLTRIARDGTVEPALAESWQVSGDGLVYTFRLRAGVTFHDGTAFDAEAVRFSLERARAADSRNAQKQLFEPIASVEVRDPLTVVVTLRRPTSSFLAGLGWGDAVIVAPNSAATNATNPIGTGPFRFVSWTRGDRVELARYPAYRDAARIGLERVTFRFISDAQAQVAALKSGQIDGVTNLAAPELFAAFRDDPRFAAVAGLTEGEVIAAMNNGRPPLDDIRVRRALAHAVDRVALIEGAYSGLGQPIGSHFSPAAPGYVDLTGRYPYDPAKARALLAEAGHASGLVLTLRMPQMSYARRSAEILQAMFAEVGVTLKLEPVEFPGQWIEQVFRNKAYDLTVIAHTEPNDIGIYARDDYYFNYHGEALKALLAKAETARYDDQRLALIGDAQRQIAEDCVNIFLFELPKLGVWNAHLKGMWENWPIPANPMAEVRWDG